MLRTTFHGRLRVTVRCDVVGVSACDDGGDLWKVSVIGLVCRGGTGRGRFTNRPYGLYGRSERLGRAWLGFDSVDVSACACDVGRWMVLFIGFVRRGGTGRGRFTNRPYGLYGRSERRVCVCVNRMLG